MGTSIDNASKARFYQYRLLNVLLSKDIKEIMDNECPNSGMDLIDSKYWILDNWEQTKSAVMDILKVRLD